MLQIQVRGLKELNKYIIDLPKNTEKEMSMVIDEFGRAVQKSAKLRAPRLSGELANSIRVIKKKKNEVIVIVDSPYGIFQEEGFRPHWVHALMPTRSSLGTIGDVYNISGFMFVSKFTPFIKPALEHNLNLLPNIIERGMNKALKK